jgi:galactokinase
MVGRSLEPAAKALLCQKAEHTFAGVPCGIMDQFIAAMGRRGHALLLDCASRATRLVPLADPSVCVLIANTNRKHELVGGEYAQRRAQCEKAAKALGVPSLRHARVEQLSSAAASLDPLSLRRARHVIGEITRTTQAAQMMTRQRWDAVGQLMYESHASLRDDFQVSTPELDLMVELARGLGLAGGVYGSRMTGGGFGGCTVTLVQSHQLDAVRGHLQSEYQRRTGIEPTLFATSPAEGARVLDLAAR